MQSYYIFESNYTGYLTLRLDIPIWEATLKAALNVYSNFGGNIYYYDYASSFEIDESIFNLAINLLAPHYFLIASNNSNLKDPIIIDARIVDLTDDFVEIEYYCANKLRYEFNEYLS